MSVWNKRRAVIHFLNAENVSPIGIHRRVKVIHGGGCAGISDPLLHRADLVQLEWQAAVQETDGTDEIIRDNRRVCLQRKTNKTAVSRQRVQEISADLGYRNLCTRHPLMFTEKAEGHFPTVVGAIWACRRQVLVQHEPASDTLNGISPVVRQHQSSYDSSFC